MIRQYNESGAHFYYPDGRPAYDVKPAQAKKEGLFPSPTTIIKLLAKEQLINWKISQFIKSCHKVMREFPDSTEDELGREAKVDFDKRNNAAVIGTEAHRILEIAMKGSINPAAFEQFFGANANLDLIGPIYLSIKMAYDWACKNLINVTPEKVIVNTQFEYAGMTDIIGECLDEKEVTYLPSIVDWKSQRVKHPGFFKSDATKLKKPRVNKYKEWLIQLGAYAAPGGQKQGIIGIIGTDPSFPYFEAVYYDQEKLVAGFKVFRCLQMVKDLMESF